MFNHYHLRDIIVSYERLINIIYDHMIEAYQPDRLRLTLVCNPRGGISSKLVIDADWKDRGGEEKFKDYPERDDEWGILM